jgi:antitoxin CptB
MAETEEDLRLKRLKFRAWHRGFVEADLILGPFVDHHAAALTPAQLTDLETLLDEADQDIYAWIIGREPVPAAFDTEVMQLIRGFRFFAHTARAESQA